MGLPTRTHRVDADELKRSRRLGRKMKSVYAELDVVFARATDGMKLTCTSSGCAGCCYQLVLITLPEGVAIAEYLLSDAQRQSKIPGLMHSFFRQLQQVEPSKSIRQDYFRKKVACSFLDEANCCTIYSVRPGACRYHAVVSDKALCASVEDVMVSKVDVRSLDVVLVSEASRVSKQLKLPLFVAPLPAVVPWALKLLIEGRAAFDAALEDSELGGLNLLGWVECLRADESS
jgi:Fe-S-cluster containining protein